MYLSLLKIPSQVFWLSCLLVFGGINVEAQQVVHWKNFVEPSSGIQKGDTLQLIFESRINAGFHLYSARKTEKDGPLITVLETEQVKGLKLIGELKERDGELHTAYDEIFETEVYEYFDRVTFTQKAILTSKKAQISGYLSYGVCNETGCRPGENEFSLKVKGKKKP